MSGSDCGHIFFWDKHTGKIVNIIEADKHVVNCVQENPLYPGKLKLWLEFKFTFFNKKNMNKVLATSGIDYNVKIWEPTLETPVYDDCKIEMVILRIIWFCLNWISV